MSFGSDMRAYARRKNLKVDQVVRATLLEVSTRVVLRTPVDTGRARGNWQASVGNASTGVLDAKDNSGSKAIGAASAAITNAPGRVYWLVNNLAYIQKLEYEAHSQQAPAGMLRISIREVQDILRSVIGKTR